MGVLRELCSHGSLPVKGSVDNYYSPLPQLDPSKYKIRCVQQKSEAMFIAVVIAIAMQVPLLLPLFFLLPLRCVNMVDEYDG